MRYTPLDRLLFAILRAMRAFGGTRTFEAICFLATMALICAPFVLAYLGLVPGWERP